MVQDLAQRAGLPKLKVYLINEAQRNALAIGRSREHAAVVATIGILQVLSAREMRSVMAHELANVRHRDIQIPTISPTMAGAMWALASLALFFGGRCADGCPANPLAGIACGATCALSAALIQRVSSRVASSKPTAAARKSVAIQAR